MSSPLSSGPSSSHEAATKKALTYVDQRLQNDLPPEDFKRVADARRSMWTGGLIGFATGAALGFANFVAYRRLLRPAWLSKNHGLLFTLGGGAAGAYVGTTIEGQQAVRGLGDVFERMGLPADSYRARTIHAKQQAEAQGALEAERLRGALGISERQEQQLPGVARPTRGSAGTLGSEDDGGIRYEEAPTSGRESRGLQ